MNAEKPRRLFAFIDRFDKIYVIFRVLVPIILFIYITVVLQLYVFISFVDRLIFIATAFFTLYYYYLFLAGKLDRNIVIATSVLMAWYIMKLSFTVMGISILYLFWGLMYDFAYAYLVAYLATTFYLLREPSRGIKVAIGLLNAYILIHLFTTVTGLTFLLLVPSNYFISIFEYHYVLSTRSQIREVGGETEISLLEETPKPSRETPISPIETREEEALQVKEEKKKRRGELKELATTKPIIVLAYKLLTFLVFAIALSEIIINGFFMWIFALNDLTPYFKMPNKLLYLDMYLRMVTVPIVWRSVTIIMGVLTIKISAFVYVNSALELGYNINLLHVLNQDLDKKKKASNPLLISLLVVLLLKYSVIGILLYSGSLGISISLMISSLSYTLTGGLSRAISAFFSGILLWQSFGSPISAFLISVQTSLLFIDLLDLLLIALLFYKFLIMRIEERVIVTAEKVEVEPTPAEEEEEEALEEISEIVAEKRLMFSPPVKIEYPEDDEFYNLSEEDQNILESLYSVNSFREAVNYLKRIKGDDIDKDENIIRYVPENYREEFLKWFFNYSISMNRPDIVARILASLGRFDDLIPLFNAYAISRELVGDYESIEGFKEWLKYLLTLYDKEDILEKIEKLKPIIVS